MPADCEMLSLTHCPRISLHSAVRHVAIAARSVCCMPRLMACTLHPAPFGCAAKTAAPLLGPPLGGHWQAPSPGRRHFRSSFVVRAAADVAVGEAYNLITDAGWRYLDVRCRKPGSVAGSQARRRDEGPLIRHCVIRDFVLWSENTP